MKLFFHTFDTFYFILYLIYQNSLSQMKKEKENGRERGKELYDLFLSTMHLCLFGFAISIMFIEATN